MNDLNVILLLVVMPIAGFAFGWYILEPLINWLSRK